MTDVQRLELSLLSDPDAGPDPEVPLVHYLRREGITPAMFTPADKHASALAWVLCDLVAHPEQCEPETYGHDILVEAGVIK